MYLFLDFSSFHTKYELRFADTPIFTSHHSRLDFDFKGARQSWITSSLLTTPQSRLEDLDIENVSSKQKLLELSGEPRELGATPGEFRRPDRPGKGSKMHTVSPDPPQAQQNQEVPPLSPCRTQHSSSADNFLFLHGTGDNNSRIRTASSASSITSKSASCDGMAVDEEEEDSDDDEAEVLLIEGDSIDECEEIEEDNASDPETQLDSSHCGKLKTLVHNDDRTSIASAAFFSSSSCSLSAATIASLGALILRKHPREMPAREALSKTQQSTSRKEGNDCPSMWSASSTDVEHYLQLFRQDLMDKSKPLTIMPS
ncbi:unnamed protein product [Taenia asiatica]|uniref:Cyclin-dependent kinase inhibitor n=1 Tax=Taenia asiatica TaxID=60517 RepID=A0A0R3VZB0_TAEAS|nr:unnamed protein product [Taenia asiatica]